MMTIGEGSPGRLRSAAASMLRASARTTLIGSAALIVICGLLDWLSGSGVSLGVLYVLPILLASTVLKNPQIVALALFCAAVRSIFIEAQSTLDFATRFLLGFVAYVGAGLFLSEVIRNRALAVGHLEILREETKRRREMEEEWRLLAESSPAAIMTLDDRARVLTANESSRQLFGVAPGAEMKGLDVGEYLPVLADALKLDAGGGFFRTEVQSQGRRRNGEIFVAQTWFSTYETERGRRLAAIAVDVSEEMRAREEQNLRQLVDNNRIIAGAVSHEIRNICGAASVLYSNLKRAPGLTQSEDFHALGSLVQALEKVSSMRLRARDGDDQTTVDLRETLDHLRIVIAPSWEEIDGRIAWNTPARASMVEGESYGLMQAFLNLAQNSHRAVRESARRELEIGVWATGGRVLVSFADSGPGVSDPAELFAPFQPGAEQSGLGLYVSRAILRSYGGDLRYEPEAGRCRFVAELLAREGGE